MRYSRLECATSVGCDNYDYGLRLYSPSFARWLSRDPIGERGGMDLYAFARNSAISRYDPIGLASESGCPCTQKDIDDVAYRESVKARELSITDGAAREFCGLLCCDRKTRKVRATPPHGGELPVVTISWTRQTRSVPVGSPKVYHPEA